MRVFTEIRYTPRGQMLDLFLPDGDFSSVFVYFHGGGLDSGSRRACKRFRQLLCDSGVAVISADYRMYPQADYPDFIEDAADAVAWTAANIGNYSACPNIFVGGSSAGAYLSMMLCFHPDFLSRRGISPSDINGYIHNAGQPTAHFAVLKSRGQDPTAEVVDETAPIFHISPRSVYPPMLFLASEEDMPGRLDQNRRMISALRACGHSAQTARLEILPGTHCQQDRTTLENGENQLGRIILDFIGQVLSRNC